MSERGTPEATVIGSRTKLPARAAALVNGTASHALDYDDTHFLHIADPSVAIFPAALALAERQNVNGADFLTAAMCLVGRDTGAPDTYTSPACSDPALARLRDCVEVSPHETLRESACRVTVETSAGQAHCAAHDLNQPMEIAAGKRVCATKPWI